MPFYEASHRSLRFQLSQQPLPALSRATIARSAPPSWLSSLPHLGPLADRTHCDLIKYNKKQQQKAQDDGRAEQPVLMNTGRAVAAMQSMSYNIKALLPWIDV